MAIQLEFEESPVCLVRTWHLLTFLQSLNLQRKGGEIRLKAKFIRKVWSAVDEVHCVTEWGSSSNNKNRSAFRVWYFHDSRNFNYTILTPVDLRHQYGISGRESQTSFIRISHIVAEANERRLYSQAIYIQARSFSFEVQTWVAHWQPVGRQHSIFGRIGDQWVIILSPVMELFASFNGQILRKLEAETTRSQGYALRPSCS